MRLHLSLGNTAAALPDRTVVTAPPAATWPFIYPLPCDWPDGPVQFRVDRLHDAFVNHQTASTRLVTTQATFLIQAWMDAIADRDVVMVATGDRESLARHAPELLARRGVFADAIIDEDPLCAASQADREAGVDRLSGAMLANDAGTLLARAMRAQDPTERLRLCLTAMEEGRTPAALLAAASTCMEVNDLASARRDLDEALQQAPDWAALHFERGKLWLRLDDMEQAAESFRHAAAAMPRFGSAWANLGATLGELDRPAEALAAFSRALECDPDSHQALNNVGVVSRELGRLAESETAFRRVVQLVPEMAFGYYNLGHTLFLQGRYKVALSAYVEGQKRDPERNPVQATRLAMCRLASGDAAGALVELKRATAGLPRDYRQQLLADTSAIGWALLTHRPDIPGWHQVNDWLAAEMAK